MTYNDNLILLFFNIAICLDFSRLSVRVNKKCVALTCAKFFVRIDTRKWVQRGKSLEKLSWIEESSASLDDDSKMEGPPGARTQDLILSLLESSRRDAFYQLN